jgi:hypothetical protein
MESQYFVLFFSKYSENSQIFFQIAEKNQINLSFIKFVCIDNKKIRERIKKSKDIQITLIPCLLNIFQNGTVDKYEGESLFQWLNNYISSLKPVEPPKQIENPIPVPVPKTILNEDEFMDSEYKPEKKPKKTFKVKNSDEDFLERHRNFEQPKRIRKDETEYIEDEELFSGDKVDNRISNPKAIAPKNPEINNISMKAKEIAQGREETEIMINKPQKR